MFENANNQYLMCTKRVDKFKNSINIGNYKFQYGNTNIVYKEHRGKSIIIFGKFVDSYNCNKTDEEIALDLLEADNLDELINRSKKIAGRFIIVYNSDEGLFVIPDVITSIHVAYTVDGNDLYISSNPKIIADINNWEESSTSKEIKSSADNSHPLPYDLTMYDEIKFVIPNNYLDCSKRTVNRYYPLKKGKEISSDEAAKISSKLINNIIVGYYHRYKLSLPLTSGMDSRLILSACKDIINEIPIYTFFHDNFTEKTADIVIPRDITSRYKLNYIIMEDLELPDEVLKKYKDELGSSVNFSETKNVWTYYNSDICDYVRLDGNVSPLAKSNFGRDLPEFLATSSYLITKTHNYAKENKKEVKRWIKDVNPYSKHSNISKFDLFFWEHRCGKWVSNSYLTSDLLINSLNPFNCRELVETWLRVPRKERMNGSIHKKIIELNWPELLEFPINPDEKYKIAYNNSLLYYIGSKVKYVYGRNKYYY